MDVDKRWISFYQSYMIMAIGRNTPVTSISKKIDEWLLPHLEGDRQPSCLDVFVYMTTTTCINSDDLFTEIEEYIDDTCLPWTLRCVGKHPVHNAVMLSLKAKSLLDVLG